MSKELDEVHALCQETKTEVAVLQESHAGTRRSMERIEKHVEKIEQTIQHISENNNKQIKLWHIAFISVVYTLIAIFHPDRLAELFLK